MVGVDRGVFCSRNSQAVTTIGSANNTYSRKKEYFLYITFKVKYVYMFMILTQQNQLSLFCKLAQFQEMILLRVNVQTVNTARIRSKS